MLPSTHTVVPPRRSLRIVPAFVVLAVLFVSDAAADEARPRVPGATWLMYASPEEAGYSSEEIENVGPLYERSGAAGLLVIHDGAVLAVWGDVETRFMCHSVRKSFLNLLYGIHIDEGHIDTDRTMEELRIDDIEPSLTDIEKQARVIDLLRARSGIYHPAAYEPDSMKTNRPARGSHAPGEHFFYNNWDFNTLLTIFEQETGTRFFEEFHERLAEPLGMQDFRVRDGYYHLEPRLSQHPAYPFRLSARDMARVGLLVMRGGKWGDAQLVRADWIRESTRIHSPIESSKTYAGYGYLWWIAPSPLDQYGMVSARGSGGHTIDVLPECQLVFVFRADTFHGGKISTTSHHNLIQAIVDARVGAPATEPSLVPLPDAERSFTTVALPADYLSQFPVTLRRLLPPGVRMPPVRIEPVDDGLVLFTRPPPAMNLDLLPTAEDRFMIEGMRGRGAIERDEDGRAVRFLIEDDLLVTGKSHLARGEVSAAADVLARVGDHFPGTAIGRLWWGESLRAQGDRTAAREQFRKASELAHGDESRQAEFSLLADLIRSVEQEVDAESLDQLTGRYELDEGRTSTVVRQGVRLAIQTSEENWVSLVPTSKNVYRLLENPSLRCVFTTDDDGQGLQFTIEGGDEPLTHRRVAESP